MSVFQYLAKELLSASSKALVQMFCLFSCSITGNKSWLVLIEGHSCEDCCSAGPLIKATVMGKGCSSCPLTCNATTNIYLGKEREMLRNKFTSHGLFSITHTSIIHLVYGYSYFYYKSGLSLILCSFSQPNSFGASL